jgi:hypothetical protein
MQKTEDLFPIHPISKNAASYASHQLRQSHLRRMTLKSSSQTRLVQIAFLALGAGCVCFGMIARQGWLFDGIAIAMGIVFVLLSLFLPFMLQSFVFDKDSNSFRLHHGLASRTEPLTNVIGVQLIDSGEHEFSLGNDNASKVRTFELNLVLKGEPPHRINLLNNPNVDSSRSIGERLAEFLEVPFQDAITNLSTPTVEATRLDTPFSNSDPV